MSLTYTYMSLLFCNFCRVVQHRWANYNKVINPTILISDLHACAVSYSRILLSANSFSSIASSNDSIQCFQSYFTSSRFWQFALHDGSKGGIAQWQSIRLQIEMSPVQLWVLPIVPCYIIICEITQLCLSLYLIRILRAYFFQDPEGSQHDEALKKLFPFYFMKKRK